MALDLPKTYDRNTATDKVESIILAYETHLATNRGEDSRLNPLDIMFPTLLEQVSHTIRIYETVMGRQLSGTQQANLERGLLAQALEVLHTWDELRWSLQEAGCSHRATLEQSIFLLKREGYVQEIDGNLSLNDTSAAIHDLLSQHLPIMCSPAYHRRLEGGLAQVAAGKYSSQQFLNTFWQHFRPKLTALNLAAQAHASLPRMVQPLLLDLVAEDHHDDATR